MKILKLKCFKGKTPTLPKGQEKKEFYRLLALLQEPQRQVVREKLKSINSDNYRSWINFLNPYTDDGIENLVLEKISAFNLTEKQWRFIAIKTDDIRIKTIALRKVVELDPSTDISAHQIVDDPQVSAVVMDNSVDKKPSIFFRLLGYFQKKST